MNMRAMSCMISVHCADVLSQLTHSECYYYRPYHLQWCSELWYLPTWTSDQHQPASWSLSNNATNVGTDFHVQGKWTHMCTVDKLDILRKCSSKAWWRVDSIIALHYWHVRLHAQWKKGATYCILCTVTYWNYCIHKHTHTSLLTLHTLLQALFWLCTLQCLKWTSEAVSTTLLEVLLYW